MTQTVDALLERASDRQPIRTADARSGSTFERLTIDDEAYFLKRTRPSGDWIMRVTGDHVHRPYLVWQAGVMDQAPAGIDHAVVAMAVDGTGDDAELSIIMRDVGDWLVPPGDEVVPLSHHVGFIEHMAQMAATYWGWTDTIGGLTTMADRLRFFAPDNIAVELLVDEVPFAIAAADQGWAALPARSALLATTAAAVHARPELLPVGGPTTFLHGDWKMGNLGVHPDGRTILIDWAYPGAGPACWELCWYLALNQARLPESKEETVERYRRALEAAGVGTTDWWQTQLDVCTIGVMVTFGWEKALGSDAELLWWEGRVAEAIERQRLRV